MVCLREKGDLREDDPAKKARREIDLTREAIDLLGKLAPEFRGYHLAQCQRAYTALQRVRFTEKLLADPKKAGLSAKQLADLALVKERAEFQASFQKIMQSLKGVSADTDATTTQLYFSVQLEQGNLIFASAIKLLDSDKKEDLSKAAKLYGELNDFTKRMQQEFAVAGNRLPDDLRANFAQAMTALENRYRHGAGQLEYRDGRYANVLTPALTGVVVDTMRKLRKDADAEVAKLRVQVQKNPKDEGLQQRLEEAQWIVLKDDRVVCNLLGLAMRANVQVGKISEALEVLTLLQRVRPEKGAYDPVQPELETFIRELKLRMKTLTDQKDTKNLAITTKNFSLFLEKMTLGQDVTKLNQKDRVFLANCYSHLNRHAEAIKYLEKVEAPKIDPTKKFDKMDKKELQDLQQYWLTQVLYGHELRMDRQLPEAKKVLEKMLAHPQSIGKFLAQKELLHVEEDAGRFGNATAGWGKLLQNDALLKELANTGGDQERAKTLYFDCYYHFVYSNFMYGKKLDKKDKQDFFFKRSADYIKRLDGSADRDGWRIAGPRFLELIQAEPLLWAHVPDIVTKYNLKQNKN
jgi:hypothetical protein